MLIRGFTVQTVQRALASNIWRFYWKKITNIFLNIDPNNDPNIEPNKSYKFIEFDSVHTVWLAIPCSWHDPQLHFLIYFISSCEEFIYNERENPGGTCLKDDREMPPKYQKNNFSMIKGLQFDTLSGTVGKNCSI